MHLLRLKIVTIRSKNETLFLNRMPRKLVLSRRAKNWKRKRTEEIRTNLTCTISIPFGSTISVLRKQICSYGNLPHGDAKCMLVKKMSHDFHYTIMTGWILNPSFTEYVQLYQFQRNNPDRIYYSLKIKNDFSWLLHLCGQKVKQKNVIDAE